MANNLNETDSKLEQQAQEDIQRAIEYGNAVDKFLTTIFPWVEDSKNKKRGSK